MMLAYAFRACFGSTVQKSPGYYMELPCRFSGYPKTYGVMLILLVGISVSSAFTPLSLSDGRVESKISSNGRHLLQAKKGCLANFEFLNYTIITSRCKGPGYQADICCRAFKELACPYSDFLNDLTTNCASTLFSYINLYGKYTPGLFANECKESKRGLECTVMEPTDLDNVSRGSRISPVPPAFLMAISGLLALL